jgi:hypothetical protein
MRRNYRGTARRICAVAALVMVTAWGIPALAPAPAALASPAVASAATHSPRPRTGADCITYVLKYYKNLTAKQGALVATGCSLGGTTIIGVAPNVSISIQFASCGGFLTAALIDPVTMTFACLSALGPGGIGTIISTQYCGPNFGSDCLNAWGGGPYVNVYTGGDENSDTNQHFMVINEVDQNGNQTGTAEIMFAGNSSWNGQCIGDASNNSGLADVSLDACATPSQTAGWGTQFTWGTSGCPSGTVWFHDNHWNGYLGPPANPVNGSHWYLNKPNKVCLDIWTDVAAAA